MGTTSVSGKSSAHGPRSLFPRTAFTGAMVPRRASTSAEPMSPAWTIRSTPRSAASASGRTRPSVSVHLDDREDARAVEAGGQTRFLDREAVDDPLAGELGPREGVAPAVGTE